MIGEYTLTLLCDKYKLSSLSFDFFLGFGFGRPK